MYQDSIKYLLVLLWAVLLPGWTYAQSSTWKAGAAKISITPEESLWMAGYASRDRPADGTLNQLWAKALAIEDSVGNKSVFVSSDLLGLPKNISDSIVDRLMLKHQLDRSQVMLTSSHTHSGPVLSRSLSDVYPLTTDHLKPIDIYAQRLENKIVELVSNAFNNLEPALVYSGMGQVRFAVNRRNNIEKDVPFTHEFKGPVDHSVPVLKLQRMDSSLLAIVFGYACHATTLNGNQWSGDYPGFAQIELESDHPGAVALFFAGCGGDQNPLPRRTVPLAEQYGRELSAAVSRSLEEPMQKLSPFLQTTYQELELLYGQLPNVSQLDSLSNTDLLYQKKWALRWLETINAGDPIPASYPSYPIQTWQLGSQTWVALGGEVVVDYSISLKRKLGQNLFVTAYANNVMAYIPSVRVLNEGGYEGLTSMRVYGLPAPWSSEVEERIIAEVQRQVKALQLGH